MSSNQASALGAKSTRRIVLAVMFIAFLVLLTWALYTFLTSKYPGANDFYLRWRGAYAFWVEHRSPYDKAVSAQVELDLYGHPASTDPADDQYPGDFLYPFFTAILLAPIASVPYAVAEAIWLALTAAAVVVAFLLSADLFDWRLPPWLLMLGIVWVITFYPAARGIFLGQPGTIVACLEIVILWALAKEHDIGAGTALAVSLIKPQLGLLLIPFLMLWALRFRRWRFIASFAIVAGLLVGASFLLYPPWLGEMLKQVNEYNGYTKIGSPIWVITNYSLPFLGHPAELAITAVLLLIMLWAWMRVIWQRESALFMWTAALTLTVTHLISVRTATPHFVVFILPIVFYFRLLYRVPRYGRWLVAGTMLMMNVALWWLFLTTLTGHFEHAVNYLPLPWGVLLLLLTTQNLWRQALKVPQPGVIPIPG